MAKQKQLFLDTVLATEIIHLVILIAATLEDLLPCDIIKIIIPMEEGKLLVKVTVFNNYMNCRYRNGMKR